MANKTVKSGEEYKVLKQTSKIKKIANLFSIVWVVGVVVPAVYFMFNYSEAIRNWALVKGIDVANNAMISQYDDLTKSLVKNVDVSKYTSKIDVPEVKLDSVATKTEKVSKTANVLSKFGVKGADKVADSSAVLQKQVDKINSEIKEKTNKFTKKIESDLNTALKKELQEFGKKQMQKQLKLSDANYKNLVAERYGFMTESERKISASIYNEFAKNKTPMISSVIKTINKYFIWFELLFALLIVVVGFIPVIVVRKIAKMFTDNFTKCPYCGKVFLSKKAKLNILAKFKFW